MLKMICTDVDGTLLPDGGCELNPEYFTHIERFTKMGILFTVVSGRPYSSVKKLFAPVLNMCLFICENGGSTIYRGNVLSQYKIPRDIAWDITRDIQAIPGCTTYISGQKMGYVTEGADDLYKWLHDGYRVDLKKISRMPDDLPLNEQILGVEMYHPTDSEGMAKSSGLYDKWRGHKDVQIVCSGKQWMNFTSIHADKGIAVSTYQNTHNIQPSETIAFGDNMNDIGMLLRAGESYAVANARKEVKSMCNHLCDSNVNDGVLKILRTI